MVKYIRCTPELVSDWYSQFPVLSNDLGPPESCCKQPLPGTWKSAAEHACTDCSSIRFANLQSDPSSPVFLQRALIVSRQLLKDSSLLPHRRCTFLFMVYGAYADLGSPAKVGSSQTHAPSTAECTGDVWHRNLSKQLVWVKVGLINAI